MLDPYPVEIEDDIKYWTVTRDWMSVTYGGANQGSTPAINKAKFTHGIDNFYFLTYDHNPAAPKKPGYPGLFFATQGGHKAIVDSDETYSFLEDEDDATPWRVITRLRSCKWLYMGEYILRHSNVVTMDEWNAQSTKVIYSYCSTSN